jgi:hypothetical protein
METQKLGYQSASWNFIRENTEGAVALPNRAEEHRLLKELAPDREGSGLKPMAERMRN